MPSPLLVLLLSCLCAALPLASASASAHATCSGQWRPDNVAFRNQSVFANVYNASTVLSHIVARIDTATGRVQQRYVLDAHYVVTALFTSATQLFSVAYSRNTTGPLLRQDVLVHDIATGRLVRTLLNLTGSVQSSDDAGSVLARANYHTVDLLDALTGKVLHTIDVDKGSLLPLAVQLHPTNGHVYVLNEAPWQIVQLLPNSTVVATTPLAADDQPTTLSLDAAAHYAYTLRVDTQAAYTVRQYDVRAGKAGWGATLGRYPTVRVVPSLAAGLDGEVWLGEGGSGSLVRYNATGNMSLCLEDKAKPDDVAGVQQRAGARSRQGRRGL